MTDGQTDGRMDATNRMIYPASRSIMKGDFVCRIFNYQNMALNEFTAADKEAMKG